MASISETTAVSLRKGSTASNLNFTGTLGEVVADLGIDASGTDINTTLRLHNGVNSGGIPLARADMANIETSALAQNRRLFGDKNLAYADLSNFETTEDPDVIAVIKEAFDEYGLATDEDIARLDKDKANKTMDNVDTASLATGEGETGKHSGKNLAYADGSNVNTKYFANETYRTGLDGDNALAYASLSNVDTTNLTLAETTRPDTVGGPVLARVDMTNISATDLKNKLDTVSVEYNTNKVTSIDPDSSSTSTEYPTTGATIEYVANELDKLDYMNPNFDNASTWDPLYAKTGTSILYNTNIDNFVTDGTDFNDKQTIIYSIDTETETTIDIPAIIPTNKALSKAVNLKMAVYSLNPDSNPYTVRLWPEYGITQINNAEITFINNSGSKVIANLECTPHPTLTNPQVYHYCVAVAGDEAIGPDGTPETSSGWNCNDSININEVPSYPNIDGISVIPVLMASINEVTDDGKIIKLVFDPENSDIEISPDNPELLTLGHPFKVKIESGDEDPEEKYATAIIESGTNATFNLSTIIDETLPIIGGASLLKNSLDNLPGMTTTDILENDNAAWTINKVKAVPSHKLNEIDVNEEVRLATIKQVWEAAIKASEVTFKKWS